MSSVIFYGYGKYAEDNLEQWASKGLVPVCFVDNDQNKHYRYISINGGIDQIQILPLKEALQRYPDAEICITTIRKYWHEIFHYLVSQGISKTSVRIPSGEYFDKPGKPKNCPLLGSYVILSGPGISTCCTGTLGFCLSSKGRFADDIEQYKNYCANLIQDQNKGVLNSCTGCWMLQDGKKEPPKINTINLSSAIPGGDMCNLKCSYCYYGENLDKYSRNDNVLEIIQYMSDYLEVENVYYVCGEITVSPFRNEILDIWKRKKWKGHIGSNCVIYNEKIAELLSDNLIFIYCSIDAGTSETFLQIKGVDCYNKVLGTIRKYFATGGKIVLKYILLEGINDSEENLSGFLDFSKEVNAKVNFSRDCRILHLPMTENEYKTHRRFIELCRQQNIPCTLIKEYMTADDIIRLEKDGLF